MRSFKKGTMDKKIKYGRMEHLRGGQKNPEK